VTDITSWQKDHPGESGGEITIKDIEDKIRLPTSTLSLPQLQRLRRQFITLNRQHSLEKSRIRQLFIDYLNDAFGS
jgi:protein KTI12